MNRARGWARQVGPALLLLALLTGPAGAEEAEPAALSVTATVVAEAPQGPLTLTPQQAGRLAATQALEVDLAREGVVQAQAQVEQAAAGRRLTAQATAVVGRTGPVATVEFGDTEFTLGSPDIQQATLSVTQPVYTGGRVERALEAAQAGVASATHQVEAAARSLNHAAQQAAYGVLRAGELLHVTQRRVESTREHLRLARVMYEAGTVAQFEVVQAQTELSRAEGDLIAVQTGVEQARAALRRVLNLAQTQPLQVAAPDVPLHGPPGELAELIDRGWTLRPELTAARATVQRAEAGVRLAQAGLNLSAALSGQYTRLGAGGFGQAQDTWQIVLSAQKPLLDGGQRRAARRQAESGLRAAHLALESEQQQVALEITRQYLSREQAGRQLQVATQGVVEAAERLRISRVRFEAGVTPGVEVLDAQTALAAAEAAQVNAGYDLHLALIGLNYAVGQPLEGEEQP